MLFPPRRRVDRGPRPAGAPAWTRPAGSVVPRGAVPRRRHDDRVASVASILFHAAIIAFVIYAPSAALDANLRELDLAPAGPGPAGGGGGGKRGTGGDPIKFIQVQPAPAQQTAVEPPPVVPPPKLEPRIVPAVVPPPTPVEAIRPAVTPPASAPAAVPDQSKVAGTGGGTGSDGTTGSGPGSGGGVGSGVGTGRGSGTGPGTGGGGTRDTFPPSPIELFIPPLPMPDRVRGFHLVAQFEVDERGRVLDVSFTPTRDRDYNRKLEQVLKGFRFRPGTLRDGTPVRAIAQIVYDF